MPSDTKKRLIDASAKRFYRDGFRNVGIDQILADVGISKTAFYKHFTCKEDLMLAALEDRDLWFREVFIEMIRKHGGDKPADQLHALMDVTQELCQSEDFHGCIFVNAAMEFPLPHDPTHAAAVKNKEAIQMIICEIARQAGVIAAEDLSKELCLIVEGAYVTFSMTGNIQSVEVARSVARRVIDAHLPVEKKRRAVKPKVTRGGATRHKVARR